MYLHFLILPLETVLSIIRGLPFQYLQHDTAIKFRFYLSLSLVCEKNPKKSSKKSFIVFVMLKISSVKSSLYCFFLVAFRFLNTFSFLLKLNSSKKSAKTLYVVKWISAYLWQIKIEFVITLIPILWAQEFVDLGNLCCRWILAHQLIQYCAVYL